MCQDSPIVPSCHLAFSCCLLVNNHDLVHLLIEKTEKKRVGVGFIAETEVCGLLVKVLLVGTVYDTFLVGCTTVTYGGLILTKSEINK